MKYNKPMSQILAEMYAIDEASVTVNTFDSNKPMSAIKADAKKHGVKITVKKGKGRYGADQAIITGPESSIIKYAKAQLDVRKARNMRDLKKELGEADHDPVAKAQDRLDKAKKIADLKKQISTVRSEDGHVDVASAIRHCKTIIEDCNDIMSKLNGMGEEPLPSWLTDKITVAADDLNGARDYLMNPSEQQNEALDDKDVDTVKGIIKKLKGASKAHAGQAKQLQKDIEDETDLEEFTSSQIARLKKEYEPLRGKETYQAPEKFAKLRKMMDRFQKPNLLALAKADIPILSSAAKAKLVIKFGMKWKSLPEDFIPYMEIFADDNKELNEQKKGKFKEVDPKVIDRVEKMMRGSRAEKDSIANMLNYLMPPEVVDMVRYKLKITPKRGKIKF